MRITPVCTRDHLLQPLLNLKRCLSDSEMQAVRYAEHMCIDRDGRDVKRHAHNDIRRLAPDAREPLQRLKVRRNLTAVFPQQDIAGLNDMLCLHAEKSAVMDRLFKLRLPKSRDRLRCVRTGEKPARHDIDAGVCALCG